MTAPDWESFSFGSFSRDGTEWELGIACNEHVVRLRDALPEHSYDDLTPLLSQGRAAWDAVIEQLRQVDPSPHLIPLADVTLRMPFPVADYVDFYSSEHHAINVGQVFRPDSPALPRAWKHLPIGYHGRAGTVVISGTEITRPNGLRGENSFGPCLRLDIEAEVGFVVGVPSTQGTPVPIHDFAEHVFGVVLLNDWSARDIQSFETVPLGPFLGKSFATSISPWVTPLAVLQQARVAPPQREPMAAYLEETEPWGLDLALEIAVNGTVISQPPFSTMYWTAAQQLAHLTVNGASLRTGDLYASGTVSGPEPGQRGSLLELTWNGEQPIALDDGTTRGFLEDGDVVAISATAPGPIRLGEVTGRIVSTVEALKAT